MDDKGYLVAHPKLIEPNSKVVQHITHKVWWKIEMIYYQQSC